MRCRAVEPRDHAATRAVVDAAFRPEDVASFLDALRAEGCLIGEWLAEEDGETLGHVAFSRTRVERPDGTSLDAAMLTPLAVRPERQREGIGGALVRHALAVLEERGERVFLVLGHPGYYRRFGFRGEAVARVESPWRGLPAFMARTDLPLEGRVILPRAIAEA